MNIFLENFSPLINSPKDKISTMNNTFAILSKYSKNNTLDIIINGKKITLVLSEICYLLLQIDGESINPSNPLDFVDFSLQGVDYKFTDSEWMIFADHISSAAGAGGWHSGLCN